MVRTQVYIPEEEHRELITVAKQVNKSMAEIIRGFIHTGLKQEKTIDRSGKTVMRRLLDIKATGGPSDLSTNLDHYLYGAPKNKYE